MPETDRFDDTMQMEYNTQDPDLSDTGFSSTDVVEPDKEKPQTNFGNLPALSAGVLIGIILSRLLKAYYK